MSISILSKVQEVSKNELIPPPLPEGYIRQFALLKWRYLDKLKEGFPDSKFQITWFSDTSETASIFETQSGKIYIWDLKQSETHLFMQFRELITLSEVAAALKRERANKGA